MATQVLLDISSVATMVDEIFVARLGWLVTQAAEFLAVFSSMEHRLPYVGITEIDVCLWNAEVEGQECVVPSLVVPNTAWMLDLCAYSGWH